MGKDFVFGFDVLGEVQLKRRIAGVEKLPDDMREAWYKIALDFYSGIKKTFDAEGAFEGKQKWPKWSPRYLLERMRTRSKYPKFSMLRKTGALETSLTGGADHLLKVEPKEMMIGTGLKVRKWNLGILHHLGTRHMHFRHIIDLSTPQKKRWSRIMVSEFRRKLKEVCKGNDYDTETGSGSGVLNVGR